jgi:hypothetical protein
MPTTTVALFDDVKEAEQVIDELVTEGFARQDISMIANRDRCGPAIGPVETVGTGARAGTGLAVGGAAGFAAGLIALAIPGIGPVLAMGPLAAGLTGAGIGAAAGGVIGGLKQMGISEEDAGCYCEAVRRGGIVLSVTSSEERADRAAEILGQHRVVDLDECAAEWRESGWTGFDPNAEPPAAPSAGTEDKPRMGLPLDPDSLSPRKRKERRQRRAVRSYVRVR